MDLCFVASCSLLLKEELWTFSTKIPVFGNHVALEHSSP